MVAALDTNPGFGVNRGKIDLECKTITDNLTALFYQHSNEAIIIFFILLLYTGAGIILIKNNSFTQHSKCPLLLFTSFPALILCASYRDQLMVTLISQQLKGVLLAWT